MQSHQFTDGPQGQTAETPTAAELLGLFTSSLEMLCIAGYDGYFKRVSPSFETTLGHSVQDLVSRPFVEFVHPDDREKTERELRKLAEGLPTIRFENRYRCRDGSFRWLSWMAMPEAQGERIYAVASDVTERKEVEAALRASEQRYARLLASVTSYTYSLELSDGTPRSTTHSAGCLATTGYTADDFAADPYLWFTMVHPSDRDLVTRQAAATNHDAEIAPFEHRILHRDGSVRWVRHTIIAHRNGDGRLVRRDGLIEDITERKVSEERFRLLIEHAPDAMVVVDRKGTIVLVNTLAETLFGYSRDELIGQVVERLVPHAACDQHLAHRANFTMQPHARMMGKHPRLYGRRKDGSEFAAEIALSPIETEAGLLVYAAIRDVTDRLRMERTLQEKQAQLLAAQKIQQHLLPHDRPQLPGFDIAGALYPADFAAGDHFDFLAMPGGCLGIVVADVAGHGVGPAILMASTHAYLGSLAVIYNDVGEILDRVNRIVAREIDPDLFVTVFLARLDPRRRTLDYSSAGSPTAFILDACGEVRTSLPSTSFPLGIDADAAFPTGATVNLQPGDVVVLYTDGLIETTSPQEELFGRQRAVEVVAQHRHQSADQIIAALSDAALQFSGTTTRHDDVTIVIIKLEAAEGAVAGVDVTC